MMGRRGSVPARRGFVCGCGTGSGRVDPFFKFGFGASREKKRKVR